MLSDIEIAQDAKLKPIEEIAASAGLNAREYEPYGRYKAKVGLDVYKRLEGRPNGKLIYVTAMTPTPAGEGKTCTAVGLTQSLGRLGKKVFLCLREPSLGPTFGVKGGAAGGGYSQVLPMDEINLHFTGDIHAVTAAHNLLAAMIDNHLHQGNQLQIDPKRVVWRHVMDISDRSLRNIIVGLGGKGDGVTRQSGFDISVASEIMAILCLSESIADLKERLGRMLVAYKYDGSPVFARDIEAVGSMTVLLKEAIRPNLVQTLEGQPAFVHGGPFANIAHGNNSIIATRTALKLADYVVTEGGFAADLGAEKFFDIVSRQASIAPDIVVLVVSIRALKFHGGVSRENLSVENLDALRAGLANVDKHLANVRDLYGLNVVVAINRFPSDTEAELALVKEHCVSISVPAAVSEVVAKGGEGGVELARAVLSGLEQPGDFRPLYDLSLGIREKIHLLATKVYGADGVDYSREAEKSLDILSGMGYDGLPICVAKTQMSLSDDPAKKGAPTGWRLNVRDVGVSAGAGFVVVFAGSILTMPGLPKVPAAVKIDLLEDGRIVGLF